MHKTGGIILEKLLNADNGYRGRTIPCGRGDVFEFEQYRDKTLLTVLGTVKVTRAYYYDKGCKEGFCPRDKELDVQETSFSPGVRRMMGRVGAHRPFGQGSEDIKALAGIDVSAKEIERISQQLGREAEGFCRKQAEAAVETVISDNVLAIKSIHRMYACMDGTGVPMVKAETVNRRGKTDAQAKTREAKLGCIFTQTGVDKDGRPQRDEASTTYVGAIETAEEFGKRIYGEARRRGIESAKEVCVIGDGAPWIWNIAEEQFYGATHIVDLYHAREHYWNVAKVFFAGKEKKLKDWTESRRKELDNGEVEAVIKAIRKMRPSTEYERELCEREINYFGKNKKRMRYGDFRRRGLFVGSGVLEAGCRTVIGQRLKQSGMHWSVKGANSIIALRCCFLSNRWEDFWESRVCA
jgi:hypothetical protein